MNVNEKLDSSDILAKLSKKVLRDVPGAEIISDDAAAQKDQEKYQHDLDEKGSVFPSFPIEQVIRKTKQEKDRIELKQDLKKIDKQNKKTSDKISKPNSSHKNTTVIIDDSKKYTRNSQMNVNPNRRKSSPISDVVKTGKKTKTNFMERLSVNSKKRKQKEDSFEMNQLDNTKQRSTSNVRKLRKSRYSRKTFDIAAGFNYSQKRNQKMHTKPRIKNTNSLFGMDVDSFGISNSNSVKHVENWDDFEFNSMQSSKTKSAKKLQLKTFQNSKRKNLEKFFDQNQSMKKLEIFDKHENLNTTIKHNDYFQINNKLEFE